MAMRVAHDASADRDSPPLRAGRPRLLTLDQVVDGALEVGLDRFNMAMLAEHLGVGVATLYQ
jgi:hypothetical protein